VVFPAHELCQGRLGEEGIPKREGPLLCLLAAALLVVSRPSRFGIPFSLSLLLYILDAFIECGNKSGFQMGAHLLYVHVSFKAFVSKFDLSRGPNQSHDDMWYFWANNINFHQNQCEHRITYTISSMQWIQRHMGQCFFFG
jgi:hypothetical protein